VFWVILVYFNIRNTLPKSSTFLLGHPVFAMHRPINIKFFIVLVIMFCVSVRRVIHFDALCLVMP
jgi:hypothetical protein